MRFIQTMAFRSFHEQQIKKLLEDWRKENQDGAVGPQRTVFLRDRDKDDTYLMIAEFSSYDDAMKNNDRSETKEWADALGKAVEGEVSYRNYDVVWE